MKMEVNKIYNIDCLELMKSGNLNNSVDLVITDPPYEFINKDTNRENVFNRLMKTTKEIDKEFWMSFEPTELLELCKKICKKFNWYFFTNKTLLTKYINRAEQNKYKRDILLWLKPNPVPINNWHYLIDKEYIVYIHESWATFNSKEWYQNYFTYQYFPIWKKEYDHPTVKPKELLLNKIKISSNEWDLVFDPYMWSWTTAVACKELNRNFIWCEINPKYCEIAEKRLSNTLHEQSLF